MKIIKIKGDNMELEELERVLEVQIREVAELEKRLQKARIVLIFDQSRIDAFEEELISKKITVRKLERIIAWLKLDQNSLKEKINKYLIPLKENAGYDAFTLDELFNFSKK